MNKKAMSLITLIITVIVMIVIATVIIIGIENTGIIQKAEDVVADMDLKNLQQLANIAYANIYFENLQDGVRRVLTAEEIRLRMIKDGVDEKELEAYEITVENGDVFVAFKEE